MKCEVFGNPAQSAPIHKTLLPDCLLPCPHRRPQAQLALSLTPHRQREENPASTYLQLKYSHCTTESHRGNTTACKIIAASDLKNNWCIPELINQPMINLLHRYILKLLFCCILGLINCCISSYYFSTINLLPCFSFLLFCTSF